MSVKNYRFVSPGVFVNEIDNSQVPASPAGIGPVIIGRSQKGPALRPTQVNSFEEYVNIFGAPAASSEGSDVWREGNNASAPTYGAYAAQAYPRQQTLATTPTAPLPLFFIQTGEIRTTPSLSDYQAAPLASMPLGH